MKRDEDEGGRVRWGGRRELWVDSSGRRSGRSF